MKAPVRQVTSSPAAAPVVIVVDDEPLLLSLMHRLLLEAGYEVHPAAGALEALALAQRLPFPPAALVTDLRMYPVDGLGLARLFRHAFPTTQVLFVSGYVEDPGVSMEAPVLKKPFNPADLAAAVARLLSPSARPLDLVGEVPDTSDMHLRQSPPDHEFR